MGKGDIRSKKGKIRNGSFGNTRKARITTNGAAAAATSTKETPKAKKSAKKTDKTAEE
jgi:ribosomal small subunit protein bTHX